MFKIMKFVQDSGAEIRIQGYDPGEIRLHLPRALAGDIPIDAETGLATLTRSCLLARDFIDPDWAPVNLAALAPAHLDALTARQPDLVLLGTGRRLIFPPAELLVPLQQAGIGVEVMDTPAACRTFNILASEDREVVAALFMPE